MIDEIMNLAKGKLNTAFNGIPGLENMNVDDVAQVAGSSVIQSVMTQLKDGNLSTLLEMFSGDHTNEDNDIVTGLEQPVSNDLFNQFGISKKTSGILAAIAIPIILNLFNNKVNDAKQSGGFNIGDLIGQFTQNQSGGGVLDMVTDLFNGNNTDQNSSGDLLSSIVRNFFR